MTNKLNTTIIIIAAGDATRWGNYLGCPKHLIKINNEPILNRTVRLFSNNNNNCIYVVGPDDDRYRIDGSKLFVPKKDDGNYGVDKFLNSSSLWNKNGRTIVVYGDVYFTDDAVKTILDYSEREWRLFCSFKKGECFAQSFYDEHIDKHNSSLLSIVEKCKNGLEYTGGWTHYRVMAGSSILDGPAIDVGMAIAIEDITNDFDYPSDYDKFMKEFKK